MSLQAKNNYLVTFFTHSGAVGYKRYLNKLCIESEMMPVPRKLSSSCGLCLCFEIENINENITTDIESIYTQNAQDYTLIYSCEE